MILYSEKHSRHMKVNSISFWRGIAISAVAIRNNLRICGCGLIEKIWILCITARISSCYFRKNWRRYWQKDFSS